MKYAVSSPNIYKELKQKIKELGYEFIPSFYDTNLPLYLRYHADLTLTKLDDKTAVSSPIAYDYYAKKLKGVKIIKGISDNRDYYPNDTIYNAAVFKNFIIHNLEISDKSLLEQNKNFINVKQGYTKCNILIAKDKIITGDKGIYNALKNEDLETILIDDKSIELQGYSRGFIGGATGSHKNYIFVNGDLKNLPNLKMELNKICKALIDVKDELIRDIGSILLFEI
ncbi:MAG: hypothetical protein Q4P29_04450 [Tissierellia bacterium]|nr:hypothetical protein [Tissierellia bacterium]